MRYAILWASILAVALGWAAADEPKSSFQKVEEQRGPTSTTVSGTIVSTSGYTLAIETPAGNRMEFEVGSDSVLPAGIETGTQVHVSYRPGETGVSHVIEVTRLGAAPRESAATTPANGGRATRSVAAGKSAATPSVPVAHETTRSQPIRYESSERKIPLPALALIGILVLGGTVAVAFLLRNRS